MKIGIALAAYRPQIDFFSLQLRSIQDQSFRDWVCVIMADSPLSEFIDKPEIKPFFTDPRFIWIENPERLGCKRNFEKAIQHVAQLGVQAIACADQDDIWYPEKLEVSQAALVKAPPLSLVHCNMHILEGESKRAETAWEVEQRGIHNADLIHFLIRNIVAGCSMLFDAELARRYPRIPDEAQFHDHWYALVASACGGVYPIDQPLCAYRKHSSNVVGVTPFHSVFKLPKGIGFKGILHKCENGWKKSLRLAQAVKREGIPVLPLEKVMFLSRFDLGLGILALGTRHLWDDRPLLRACLARSVGKALITWKKETSL